MNEKIATILNFTPEIEYAVGNEDSYCYSPKNCGFNTPESQKKEAERYINKIKLKQPDSWVVKEGYDVKKYEHYPHFHLSWDDLMEAIRKANILLEEKKIKIPIHPDNIFETWITLHALLVLNT